MIRGSAVTIRFVSPTLRSLQTKSLAKDPVTSYVIVKAILYWCLFGQHALQRLIAALIEYCECAINQSQITNHFSLLTAAQRAWSFLSVLN
jgi:hypothetical protein